MNEQNNFITRIKTDLGPSDQDYRKAEDARNLTGKNGSHTRNRSEHIHRYRTAPGTGKVRANSRYRSRVRSGARYVGHRAAEISAFWYVILTFDLIMAIILFLCVVLTDTRPLECPVIKIEHIYKVPETNSEEHREELDVETLLDESKVYMLAHLIGGEAGADWCTDELQLMVGSVVLNRMASDKFPNEMEEVIFQQGQYSVTWNGAYYNEPSERTVANARYLLENGPTIPSDVLWQANFPQKRTYKVVQGVYFGH